MADRTSTDAGPTVRLLGPDDHLDAARLVGTTMLGRDDRVVDQAWVDRWGGRTTHGAITADGRLAGVAQWFPSQVSLAGPALPAACVTAVAVEATQRRRGHLRRMMEAQLASVAEAEVPVALLVAAEWGIYGRYGYGPAVEACRYEIDTRSADFVAPPKGTVELVGRETVRPHLEAVHDRRWARTMGAVTRDAAMWDHLCGLAPFPNEKTDLTLRRHALWRDEAGVVQGAVVYAVEERWTRNRPDGTATVTLLVGSTPEAERELWRHLCEVDWITTVSAGDRAVDDPLPHHLTDGRAAVSLDRFDCIWARILDVPRFFEARRSPLPGQVVVEVVDDLGHAGGRWRLELGPDGAAVSATSASVDVTLPAATLGALAFGGTSAHRMAHAGWLEEGEPGGVDRLETLLRASPAPWSPTTY
jgi:predicted acetyltransferase